MSKHHDLVSISVDETELYDKAGVERFEPRDVRLAVKA